MLADEYFVQQEQVSVSLSSGHRVCTPFVAATQFSPPRPSSPSSKGARECFYCHKTGHVIADCVVLKRKQSRLIMPVTEVGIPLSPVGTVVPDVAKVCPSQEVLESPRTHSKTLELVTGLPNVSPSCILSCARSVTSEFNLFDSEFATTPASIERFTMWGEQVS